MDAHIRWPMTLRIHLVWCWDARARTQLRFSCKCKACACCAWKIFHDAQHRKNRQTFLQHRGKRQINKVPDRIMSICDEFHTLGNPRCVYCTLFPQFNPFRSRDSSAPPQPHCIVYIGHQRRRWSGSCVPLTAICHRLRPSATHQLWTY